MTMQPDDKMMVLFAQPYDISASGFYFTSTEQYQAKIADVRNDCGFPVEEFEIQFIDGDNLDAALFTAVDVNQRNFGAFLDACNSWNTDQKQKVIIAVGECGNSFDLKSDDPDQFEIDLYETDSLRELAQHFVNDGIYGQIPESIKYYLDYDRIARDLGLDYTKTIIAGTVLIYRCG